MALLTRDQILGANDRKTETVPVPEWGGEVVVSVMSGEQRDAYESMLVDMKSMGKDKKSQPKMENLRAKLVACTIVGEDGNRMFSDSDVIALGKKSGAALNRVFQVASRLNRVTEEGVEEAAKNS